MTVLRIKSSLHRRLESCNLFFRKVIPAELRPCFGKREGRDPVESHPQSASVENTETPTLKDIWNQFEALYNASDNPKDRGKVATYRRNLQTQLSQTSRNALE